MRLETAGSHTIGNIRRSELRGAAQDRRLQWIVLFAFLSSVILHILLIFLFSDIRVHLGQLPEPVRAVFRIPDITISPEALAPPKSEVPIPAALEPENFPEALEEKPFDITEMLVPDDREIAITPEVKRPENINPGVAEQSARLETISPEVLEKSLATMAKGSLQLPDSVQVSDAQMVLPVDPDSKEDLTGARKALQQASEANSAIPDNFSTLDELLGMPGGKITDISKPIYMPSDLLFDFREDRLRESAKTSLMMLGMLIDRNPDTLFIIEGHTDTIGGQESNLELSRRRAQAVADWLQQSLFIGVERMRVEAMGETRPLVVPAGGIEEQQPNRRVEIRMVRTARAISVDEAVAPQPAPVTETAPARPVLPARAVEESAPDAPARVLPARPVE